MSSVYSRLEAYGYQWFDLRLDKSHQPDQYRRMEGLEIIIPPENVREALQLADEGDKACFVEPDLERLYMIQALTLALRVETRMGMYQTIR